MPARHLSVSLKKGPLRRAATVLKRLSASRLEPWQLNLKRNAALKLAFHCATTSRQQFRCTDAAHQPIVLAIDHQQSQRTRRSHLFRNRPARFVTEYVV